MNIFEKIQELAEKSIALSYEIKYDTISLWLNEQVVYKSVPSYVIEVQFNSNSQVKDEFRTFTSVYFTYENLEEGLEEVVSIVETHYIQH